MATPTLSVPYVEGAAYQRNPRTLLALARVNQELQNYPDAKSSYEKLRSIDPTLAGQFAFLGEGKESGARAADIQNERKTILWETDQ